MSQENHKPQNIWSALARALADAKTPWAVVALLGLALIISGCAVDPDRLARTRADLETLCSGAITLPLKLACERAGVSTMGATVKLQ